MDKKPLINYSPVYCFDIDGTLVLHGTDEATGQYTIIDCPYIGDKVHVQINKNNVRLLKEKAKRGCFIIGWSAGGAQWAEAVLKGLHIDNYVDVIISKPDGLVDDLPASTWMPKNINLLTDFKWKNGVYG